MPPFREAHHAPRQQAQPGVGAHFLADLEQELHPQADAQQRDAIRHGLLDRGLEAARAELVHARAEGPHARQDDRVRPVQAVRMLRHVRVHAQVTQGVHHAAQVAGAVVDDCDHGEPP